MEPLMSMLVALIAIMLLFITNMIILFARNKLSGILRWMTSAFAFGLIVLSFVLIMMVVLDF